MLAVRLLGPVTACIDDVPLRLTRPLERALLARLALCPGLAVGAPRLLDELWTTAPERELASLHTLVYRLRRTLRGESRVLAKEGSGYVLAVAPVCVDRSRFEELATRGRKSYRDGDPNDAAETLSAALGLWRGPALADVGDVPFALAQRAHLDELRMSVFEQRVHADLDCGRHDVVVGELEAVLVDQPLREGLWAHLILALYRCGRQGDALGAYARARRTLDEELGVEPGPALRRLERDVLAQAATLEWNPFGEEQRNKRPLPAAPPPLAPAAPPGHALVGREAELRSLEAALEGALGGSGAIVALSGEAGIGKTRLGEELAAWAAIRGAAVVWGRCHEGEGAPPLWPWIQVVRTLLAIFDRRVLGDALGSGAGHIAQIVPEVKELVAGFKPPSAVDPISARFRLAEAVGTFLGRLAAVRPLVVLLDDLHWADVASLELTEFMAAHLAGAALLLVVAYRHHEAPPASRLAATLGSLARRPHLTRVRLEGLSVEDVARHIANTVGEKPALEVAASVCARTEGNPFFVAEVARLLASQGLVDDAAGEQAAAVPLGVRDVIHQRLARLPSQCSTVLSVGAVVGREFDLDVVGAICGLRPERSLELVEAALISGILLEDPAMVGSYRFSHALVREAIADDLSALRRARLHVRVAETIEAMGEPGDDEVVVLAHHYYEGLAAGHADKAFSYALAAAEVAAARLAYESAESQLRRALALLSRLAPGEDRDREELRVHTRLGTLLTITRGDADAGIPPTAGRALELCQALGDQPHLLPALMRLGAFSFARANFPAAAAAGQTLLEVGTDPAYLPFRVGGRWRIGTAALLRGQLLAADEHLAEAAAGADSLPPRRGGWTDVYGQDPTIAPRAFRAVAASLRADRSRARQLLGEAFDLASRSGNPYDEMFTLILAAWVQTLEQDAAAGQHAGAAVRLANERSFSLYGAIAQAIRGWALAQRGEATAGVSAIAEGLSAHQATGARVLRPFLLALLAEAQIAAGHPDDALVSVDDALAEVAVTDERFYEAELYRLRGELLAGRAHRGAEAETSLRHAIAVAHQQGALLLERRAHASLAARRPGSRHDERRGETGTSLGGGGCDYDHAVGAKRHHLAAGPKGEGPPEGAWLQ